MNVMSIDGYWINNSQIENKQGMMTLTTDNKLLILLKNTYISTDNRNATIT